MSTPRLFPWWQTRTQRAQVSSGARRLSVRRLGPLRFVLLALAVSGVAAALPSLSTTLRVTGVPAGKTKWLLLDSESESNCPIEVVSTFATRETELELPEADCGTQLTVFAEGAAPVLDPNPSSGTSAEGSVLVERVPPNWPVTLDVVGDYDLAARDAKADRLFAASVFRANQMGIKLRAGRRIRMEQHAVNSVSGLTGSVSADLAAQCQAAAEGLVGIPGDVSLLHVFYVSELNWGTESVIYGYNCVDFGHPDIVFIRQNHAVGTLAHEIGHAVSLRHAGVGFLLEAYGWTDENVMQGSAFNPKSTRTISDLSLGQVYRANFSDQSWLNSGKVRTGPQATCAPSSPTDKPKAHAVGPCPQIQLPRP